jgi:two-component system, OmpR family, sensor histidine kinase BaeS
LTLKAHPEVSSTARQIGRRLFLLVFRALASMLVVLVVLLVLAAMAVLGWLKASPQFFVPTLTFMLESHYNARGSWADVDQSFNFYSEELQGRDQSSFFELTLLDVNERVVIDRRSSGGQPAGELYTHVKGEIKSPLTVNNQVIGTLIFHSPSGFKPLIVLFLSMWPFSVLAVLLGILALVIGLMLVRRVVAPLAEVIAAAGQISEGNLTARVKASGPTDLRALSDSFNQMAESLDRSDRERRELLAIVAHELRTPLSVLRGRLEGIVDGIYPADDAHIAGVLEETYLLERLVEDLRLFTLAETRQLHLDMKEVDLAEIARHSVDLFCAEAEEKKIQLNITAESEPFLLEADPQRMEQAIGNLVGNALRYVPENGRIDVTVNRLVTGTLVLTVSDNGPGVQEADLPRIFDRFWRADSARTRQSGGSGLGLAIAKELVEAQGGKIGAHNRMGGGLEVVLSFDQT